MDTIFHLNWLRDNGNNHLEADLGTVVPAHQLELAIIGLLPQQQPGKNCCAIQFSDLINPACLPEWARRRVEEFFGHQPGPAHLTQIEGFSNRIRDKAWNLPQSGLFLPFFGRREWVERFSVLPEINFDLTNDGVVAEGVQPCSVRDMAMRAAACIFAKPSTAVPLHFESNLPFIDPWRNLLLERYGLHLPAGAPALARLTLQSDGRELEAWSNSPRLRHCHYYGVFSNLALALQHALRRWTLAAFALGPAELADFDNGADVLAYSAVRPHAEKRAQDYSYDVLNGEMMDYAFGRAARRLEPLIKNANDMLLQAGRNEDARLYSKQRDFRLSASKLAQRARKRSRVRVMLVSEGVLIYSMMKFAARLKTLDSARSVLTAAEDLASDFDDRMRKLFFFLAKPEDFGTLLFMEASNAIHRAMGDPQALHVECETVDGVVHHATRDISEFWAPV